MSPSDPPVAAPTPTLSEEIALVLRQCEMTAARADALPPNYTVKPTIAEWRSRVSWLSDVLRRTLAGWKDVQKTRHGGNVGATPFYLFPYQCEPEYDQGHWVVVWYDDLYDLVYSPVVAVPTPPYDAEAEARVFFAELLNPDAKPAPVAKAMAFLRLWANSYLLNGNYWDVPQTMGAALVQVIKILDANIPRVAAPTPETPSHWQPIETCPKDRSWFLGWNEDCGCFVWRDGPGLITGEDPAPTHWMPLPDPPLAGAVSHPQPEVRKGE